MCKDQLKVFEEEIATEDRNRLEKLRDVIEELSDEAASKLLGLLFKKRPHVYEMFVQEQYGGK